MSETKEPLPLLKSAAQPQEITPIVMVQMALERGVTPDVLDRLLSVQQRYEADKARKAFDESLAAFKAECPSVMPKTGRVDFTTAKGQTAYAYTPLSQILDIVSPLLSKHGLNLSWRTSQDGALVAVTATLRHKLGHEESTRLHGGIDQSGNKNPLQALASAVTYLQRYTAIALLGLATAEIDDDGLGGARVNVSCPLPSIDPGRGSATPIKDFPSIDPGRGSAGRHVVNTQEANEPHVVEGQVIDILEQSGVTPDKKGKDGAIVKGKPWTKYGIRLAGHETPYGTFSKTVAEFAAAHLGKTVRLFLEKKGKYWNVMQIEPSEAEELTKPEDAVQ